MFKTGQYLVLAILLANIIVNSKAKRPQKTVYFTSTKVEFNSIYLQDHRLEIKSSTTLDVVLNIGQDYIKDPWVAVVIDMKNGQQNNYRTLLQYNINVCDILGRNGETIIKTWMLNFLKYGNLPKSCPILKGNYSWHDLKADKLNIPEFMPTSQYKATIDTYFRDGSKRESVANLTIFLELK